MYQEMRQYSRDSLGTHEPIRAVLNTQWTSDVPHTIDSKLDSDGKLIREPNIYFLMGILGTGLGIEVEDPIESEPGKFTSLVSGHVDITFQNPGLRLGRMWKITGTVTFAWGYFIPIDLAGIVQSQIHDGSQS